MTVQLRKLLSVLQVTASCAPGHTDTTPRGESVNLDSAKKMAVCNHWTGLMDWTTGRDYWTDL